MRRAALLKGFNLGKNRMPAPALKALFEANGYRNATTLLASGNIIFDADETNGATLKAALEAMLAGQGLKVHVLVRSGAELRAVIAANPFADVAEARPARLLVTFHRAPFPVALLGDVATRHDGPERLAAHGRELYIDFPDGQGQSRLIDAMAKAKFPKIATGRNWNTVLKLAEMLG